MIRTALGYFAAYVAGFFIGGIAAALFRNDMDAEAVVFVAGSLLVAWFIIKAWMESPVEEYAAEEGWAAWR